MASRIQDKETGRGQGKIGNHVPSDQLLSIRPHILKFLLFPQIAPSARDQAFSTPGLKGHAAAIKPLRLIQSKFWESS